MTGQMGAQTAAEWVLDRPNSSTQWSIVKQGSSGSVLCSKGSPAVYNQPALEVVCSYQPLLVVSNRKVLLGSAIQDSHPPSYNMLTTQHRFALEAPRAIS